MEKCLFCSIVDKEINSYVVNEDENYLAFLDISQKSVGHTLVIPKVHVENIFDDNFSKIDFASYQNFINETSKKLQKKLNPTGFNFISNHGKDAGQMVFHLHTHIIPRYHDVEFDETLSFDPKSEEYLTDIHQKIIG